MSKKSRLVILDADVIITCHQNGIWNQVINHYEVLIPETVVVQEANYFYSKKTGRNEVIDLQAQIGAGKVGMVSATVEDFAELKSVASHNLFDAIDPGETEAIAILYCGQKSEQRFCTGDQTAMKVASALGLGSKLASLEKLCKEAKIKANLRPSFSEKSCQDKIKKGLQDREFYILSDE